MDRIFQPISFVQYLEQVLVAGVFQNGNWSLNFFKPLKSVVDQFFVLWP